MKMTERVQAALACPWWLSCGLCLMLGFVAFLGFLLVAGAVLAVALSAVALILG